MSFVWRACAHALAHTNVAYPPFRSPPPPVRSARINFCKQLFSVGGPLFSALLAAMPPKTLSDCASKRPGCRCLSIPWSCVGQPCCSSSVAQLELITNYMTPTSRNRKLFRGPAKGGRQKKFHHFFLVTFWSVLLSFGYFFRHFLAKLFLPDSFCGRVTNKNGTT